MQHRYADQLRALDRALTIVPDDLSTLVLRAWVPADWRADLRPFQQLRSNLMEKDPAAANDIEDARTGRVHYDVFENYDMKVRVYGGHTAIVMGKTKIKGNAQGKPIDIIVQFTDTFVKQSGRWRLAAGHVSRLKE